MKTPKQSFLLIDGYARKHHCFLAEMFLNKSQSEYILCFRPAAASKDSADRFACRYLHLEVGKISLLEKAQELSDSMKTPLDQELALLSSSS